MHYYLPFDGSGYYGVANCALRAFSNEIYLICQAVQMGNWRFHDIPGKHCAVEVMTHDRVERFTHVFRRSRSDVRTIVYLDAREFGT